MHLKRHLVAIGILLLAAAPITHFTVAPYLAELPGNLDQTTVFDGSMQVPDPSSPGTMIEQPIQLERRLTVESVDGDTAVVDLTSQLFAAPRTEDAPPLSREIQRYAVDRTTFGQAAPPAGTQVLDQSGAAVFALPREFGREGNHLFDSAARAAVPLTYVATDSIAGRSADTFRAENTAEIADPDLLTTLRAGIGTLYGTDGTTVPTTALATLGAPADILAAYGDAAPVTLMVHTIWQASADRDFGALLVLEQTMQIDAVIGDTANPGLTTTLQKLHVRTAETDIARAGADLDSNASKLHLIQWWIPIVAVLLGLALIAAAIRRTPRTLAPHDLPTLRPADSDTTEPEKQAAP